MGNVLGFLLHSSISSRDASLYTTPASITPTNGRTLVLAVESQRAGSSGDLPTITAFGSLWTQAGSTVTSAGRSLSVWWSQNASFSADTMRFDYGANTELVCGVILAEFAGVATTPFVQSSVSTNGGAGSISNLTWTLAGFARDRNATYAALSWATSNVLTADSNFTFLSQISTPGGGPNIVLASMWTNVPDTSLAVSASPTAQDCWGIALELGAVAETAIPGTALVGAPASLVGRSQLVG